MSSESLQKKVGRVRPPRVQIIYEVDDRGAMKKIELPFVVGVLADLSGQPSEPLPEVADRKFIPIDRDNFNGVLAKQKPRLVLRVQNRLTDEDTRLGVELQFNHMDDFEPARVAQQVAPLRELLEMRKRLDQLLGKMGPGKLEDLLTDVLANTEKAMALAKHLHVAPGTESEAPKPEEPK